MCTAATLIDSVLMVILFWRCKPGTPGKLLRRLRIVDADSGGGPSLRQGRLRSLGHRGPDVAREC